MSTETSQTRPSLFVKEQSIEVYDSQYSCYWEVPNPKHIFEFGKNNKALTKHTQTLKTESLAKIVML